MAVLVIFARPALGLDPGVAQETSADRSGSHAVILAGTHIRIGGCDVFDVYSGPGDLSAVVLRWSRPAGRTEWLQSEFDRVIRRFDGDLWRAFVELGGGLRQSTSGFEISARRTDMLVACGSFELPVLEVEEVVGAFDLSSGRGVRNATQPLTDGLDVSDPDVQRILDAGRAALDGRSGEMVLQVEGVTDRSLGCPLWALVSSRSVSFNCGSGWGFVELRYARPELEPHLKGPLVDVLARRGVASLDELGARQTAEVLEAAERAAARGPYRYRGHFTGEITFYRGTEALFLTPVFVVEERVDEAGAGPGGVGPADLDNAE